MKAMIAGMKVNDAQPDLSQIELVHANPAKEEGEKLCRNPAFSIRRRLAKVE